VIETKVQLQERIDDLILDCKHLKMQYVKDRDHIDALERSNDWLRNRIENYEQIVLNLTSRGSDE